MTDILDPVQEQLIRERRKQILDAATTVFAEKGFHRATVRAIAREADVADGTIYNYFGNKGDLLIGILDRLNETEERDEQFAAGTEMSLPDFFAPYVRQRMDLLLENTEVLQALLPQVLVDPALRARYYEQVVGPTLAIGEQFFAAMIDKGELRSLDAPLVPRIVGGAVFGLLLMRLLGDETLQDEWERLPEVLSDVLLEGLSSKENDP